ncbi:MAG TPA: cytochrome c oxidase subunit I [Actinomycetota bacterium]|nr:cytochrome c oxidase subunit I [Actinomycetota bacterium]
MAITQARPEAAADAAHGISPRRHPIADWLTTTDHKKIGIMYLVNSYFWFGVAGLLAVFIRAELAQPETQFFAEQRYNELFTMHGTTMIFLFVIPMLAGFGNYIVPLQIGALDMAFPRVNALSFWLLPLGGIVLFSSYFLGGPADAGWTQYTPLSEGVGAQGNSIGTDLWIVSLLLVGTASILGAVNFITTIFNMRAPGMTMFRMPLFTWTILVTSLLVLLATPVFTSALVMLLIDRNLGGSFFNPANGGISVLWQNVFWFYSHPAVYVMVLPGMGIISDVLPVFSRKPLFGYKAFVFATAGIGALGFSVWAHHMFATGQVLLPFFAIMTFLIAVPTGVKFFNWIATLVKGQITFSTAMLFAIGFLTMFLIGGIDGVFLASPPVDFALHDTYWVVAHIHYVLFGGSVFAVYAGFYYWFPKFTGKKLNEGLGKLHFWLQFIGFNLTFFTMHILGLLGMPRRIQDYADLPDWVGLNQLQTVGALLIALSTAPFLANVVMTLRRKDRDPEDPWEGNTLEWYTTSPPPAHNFDSLPEIHSERPLFDLRHADELTVHPDATTTGAR